MISVLFCKVPIRDGISDRNSPSLCHESHRKQILLSLELSYSKQNFKKRSWLNELAWIFISEERFKRPCIQAVSFQSTVCVELYICASPCENIKKSLFPVHCVERSPKQSLFSLFRQEMHFQFRKSIFLCLTARILSTSDNFTTVSDELDLVLA